MKIDSIHNGYVIDHIPAGEAMKLYQFMNLSELSCPVAMIMRAPSKRMGSKDIIKIDGNIPLNLDVVGYLCPGATVNVIRSGECVEKRTLSLPEKLTDVVSCRNPRCICSVEPSLHRIFILTDSSKKTYRCYYCDAKLS